MVIGYLLKEDVKQHWIKDFMFYLFLSENDLDSHNTRLWGVKQELQDLKKDIDSSLADFKDSKASLKLQNLKDTKFDLIINRLNTIEENFQRHVLDIITEELN